MNVLMLSLSKHEDAGFLIGREFIECVILLPTPKPPNVKGALINERENKLL